MTWYPRSAYGASNPNAGYPANGDFAAWGGYKWPDCPPANLIGTASYTSAASGGQMLRVQVRKELVPLWQLVFEIQDRKHHYPVWASHNGQNWGPWGGDCRPVAGTQRASGHSAWLSVDENAPNNPYSYTFQSDMPPAMVADMETLGLYWGGRYTGQKYDPMHWGFCRKPSDVPFYIERAKSILGTLTPPPPEDDMPLSDADINKVAQAVVKQLMGTAVLSFNDPATGAQNLSYQNLLPKLGNWAAVACDNTNQLKKG